MAAFEVFTEVQAPEVAVHVTHHHEVYIPRVHVLLRLAEIRGRLSYCVTLRSA